MQFPRIRRALIVAAAAAGLTLGAVTAASPAFASDNANGATLYANNFQCGGATNLASPVGFINFHETGDQLTLIVHIKGAAPNTTYSGFLYDEFCTPDTGAFDISVTTNSNGVGNGTVTVTARPGATYFFTMEETGGTGGAPFTMQTQGITP